MDLLQIQDNVEYCFPILKDFVILQSSFIREENKGVCVLSITPKYFINQTYFSHYSSYAMTKTKLLCKC